MLQNRYWIYLREKRVYIYYLDVYAEHSYKCDKAVKIYCAAASSASIAAWAVWNRLSFVWASFIALSQVITAVYDLLPFSKRMKYAAPFIKELKLLSNRIESNWFKVNSGDLTAEEINELLYNFETEYIEMENKYLKKLPSMKNRKFLKKAIEQSDVYLERFYGMEDDNAK